MIKVESKVKAYEVNGIETPIGDERLLEVRSHSIRSEFVVLHIHGNNVTVVARDLELAIRNATNTGR